MILLPRFRAAVVPRRPPRRATRAISLAAAGLALLAAACTAPPPSAPSGSGTIVVSIRALAYEPASLEVPRGSSVSWFSEDVAAHDVTADDGSFRSGTLQQGDSFTLVFTEPGTWAYTCTLHPEMTGVITVL